MTGQPPLETKRAMSGIAIDALAQSYVRQLEDREARQSSITVACARRAVSRRTSIGAGTLANIRRGRIKGVRAWIFDALRAALITELEKEIARDERELALLKATHHDGDCEQVFEVLASIEAKRKALNGEAR